MRMPVRRRSSVVELVGRCVVVVLVAGASVPRRSAQTRNWPSEAPPRPLPAREIKFPPYDIQTLPNGLQVVVVLHHEQPAVTMRLLVRAGSASDPKDKLGLARLAASLLDQGTTTKSAQEMNDAIDFIGGAMGAGAGTDLTFVQHGGHEGQLRDRHAHAVGHGAPSGVRAGGDRAAAAADAVQPARQPRGSRVRRQLGIRSAGLRVPPLRAAATSARRRRSAASRATTSSRSTSSYFAPNNAILAVVGDVTAEEAFATVEEIFGDWERRDVPSQKYIEPPDPTRRVVSSTSRTPCRPRCASATSASRATIRTTWR